MTLICKCSNALWYDGLWMLIIVVNLHTIMALSLFVDVLFDIACVFVCPQFR